MADLRPADDAPEPDGAGAPRPASVAVCVLTLGRPVGLARLLEGLAALEPPDAAEVSVVVVDNDGDGSAAVVVDAARPAMPWELTYVVEPRRGIPFGRNRAIACAGDVDFVAFVDDDEVPHPRWLAELLATQRRTGADVVTGPVLPEFAEPPPAWVLEGGFFDRARFADGERLSWATTSSVLVARGAIPDDRPAFNEAMALTGGSDTHFFMRAQLEGRLMVWSDRAVVVETIPSSRVDARWLLRREFRRGNTLTLCLLDLRDSPVRRLRRVALGLLQVLRGTCMVVPAAWRGRAQLVRALQVVWFGAGLLAGLAGRRYEEYRVIHGS